MHQPNPTEFGLRHDDVAVLDRLEDKVVVRVFGWGVLGGTVVGFIVGYLGGDIVLAFISSLQAAALAFVICLPVAATWDSIASVFSRRIRAYRRFKRALSAFKAWDRRTRESFWRSLSGRAFEIEPAMLFERQGYKVELTPAPGDKGIDIILRRPGNTTLVQCKQTSKPVGPAVARELYGALVASEAQEAVLASISGVTAGVRDFVAGKPIRIMRLSDIIAMHQALDSSRQQQPSA